MERNRHWKVNELQLYYFEYFRKPSGPCNMLAIDEEVYDHWWRTLNIGQMYFGLLIENP